MENFYTLGLDIGIGSIGWAVLRNNRLTEEPERILKLGVRTFSPNEVDKTGESTAKRRRELRGIHRRANRKAFRVERMKKAIKFALGVDCDKDLAILMNHDIYELRAKSLDEQILNAELAKIILNLLKRRGFKSNRKNANSKEEGKLLEAVNANSIFMNEKGYRTIGEAIYKDNRFKTISCGKIIYNVRNHPEDYKNSFLRADLEKELCMILETQRKLGNQNITTDFQNRVLEIFNNQRNFDEGPDQRQSKFSAEYKIGHCTFFPDELRAPKASFTFEYFNALSKINSLKISGIGLSLEQKSMIINLVKSQEKITYTKLRKIFNIPINQTFNLCNYSSRKKKKDGELSMEEFIKTCEDVTFVSLPSSWAIIKAFGFKSFDGYENMIDEAARILSTCKSDNRIENEINQTPILQGLSIEQKEKLKALNFTKFGSLSIKAMQKIIPFLLEGKRYDEACKCAGFNHSSFGCEKKKFLKGPEIEERLSDITSNVVKRAVNQTLRILNEIIKEYGSPQFITIELARDLSRNLSDRNNLKRMQDKNFELNSRILEEIKEKFGLLSPKPLDLIKYKLYEEQQGKCMYSGKVIDLNRLFEPNYTQIDHILPISRSMNDSYNNKVLVLTEENQNKGDRTPFEWFGKDAARWRGLEQRAMLLKNFNKRRFLLMENFSEEQQNDFIERNLNDTRYISKFLFDLLRNHLQMTPSEKHKVNVKCVNGSVTSYLRKCWGVNKIREDGDLHHCIDAAIIATVTPGQVQKVTRFNKFKEQFIQDEKSGLYVNRVTRQAMTTEEKDQFQMREMDLQLTKYLPEPYKGFVKELAIRSRSNYSTYDFSLEEKGELSKLGYSESELAQIKPVFVSHMKTVKTTGAMHEDTLMSTREYNISGKLIKTVPIHKLKLEAKPEEHLLKCDKYPEYSISNYYRPSDDRLLYLKLKEYLVVNKDRSDKEKEQIFNNFHKPKSDGTDGPIVKKVKIYEKMTKCVITPQGAAANDKMYRVDVFEKNGKFYLCPVYMSDVYRKQLPNQVVVPNKPWLELDDTFNFKFSLYQNDLIKVKHKDKIILTKTNINERSNKAESINHNEYLLYYNSCNISTASFGLSTHDRCYTIPGCGVKTLLSIEKYYVDIMGNVYQAKTEERKKL